MPPTKKVPLNMRIDQTLKSAAEEVARRENRTLTNLIETLLIERCQHHGVSTRGVVAPATIAKANSLSSDE